MKMISNNIFCRAAFEEVEIHAATKETYGKIVTNGEVLFSQIIKNLDYIKEIRKQNNFAL